jgi:DNA-binding transcriptional MerR regulator
MAGHGDLRIGDLMRSTGVSRRLLRYYEEQGLLRPRRQANGYRVYDAGDVQSVRRIRCLLTAGLSTATIAELLPCLRDEGELLVPTCSESLARLREERRRLSDTIADLEASRRLLEGVIAGAANEVRTPARAERSSS